MTRSALSLAAVFALAALGAACGSSDKNQQPQNPQPYAGGYPPPGGQATGYPPGSYPPPGGQPAPGGYPPPGGGTAPGGYPPPGGGTGPAPGGQPAPGGSAAPGGFPGIPGFPAPGGGSAPSGGGTAQPLDPNLAAVAVGPLTLIANSQAPGMQKDGPTVAGNFAPGQTLEGAFTFQPGKCYTLIGQGVGVNITVEMQYATPVPGFNPSVGKSNAGSQAVLGGGSNCLKPLSPIAANAKFIITAVSGQGVAAAQLYSK